MLNLPGLIIFAVSPFVAMPPAPGVIEDDPVPDPIENQAGRVAVVHSDKYGVNLLGLENFHPFDIHKYQRIRDHLVSEKVIKETMITEPNEISTEEILRVHSESFIESLKSSKMIGKYLEAPAVGMLPSWVLDPGALRPFRYASGGTLTAGRKALSHGIGINIGGGYHHAKPNAGEGFCVYADIPIAIRALQAEGKIKRALVIDLDVHQGNGTAVCLEDDDETFTFSVHQKNIYPIPKEQSDLDVEVRAGMGDEEYLRLLREVLPRVLDAAGNPDIVFYVAGCDTLKGDPLASLEMTQDGIAERDRMVIDACIKRGIPVVMTLGGGYSKNAWEAQYLSIRSLIEQYGVADQNARESQSTDRPKKN